MRIFADTNTKLKAALKQLKTKKALGVDTETSSLDPHTCKLWSIQIGDKELQVMIPINGNPLKWNFKTLLGILMDEEVDIIFHRASFDLKVLWRYGLDANSVLCTRTMEQMLTAGKLGADTSLAGTLSRRGITDGRLSKVERKDFYCAVDGKPADERDMVTMFENSGFDWTPELQDYALSDVEHLVPLAEEQIKELKREKMTRLASKIEMPLVYVTGLIEFRGVAMDIEKCAEFQRDMAKRAEEMKEQLKKEMNPLWQGYARPIWIENHRLYKAWSDVHEEIIARTNKDRDPENRRKVSAAGMKERQEHEALRPFRTPPKEPGVININSTPQLRAALGKADVFLKDMRKETLQENVALDPLIEAIVEFRKYDKLGKMAEIYEKINKATGRLHGTFNQIVDTGRYSSRDPNLQNIPARAEEGARFRSCFVASKGCKLGVADYSAIELVIAGVQSKDTDLLYALNHLDDLHCFTMSKFLGCNYESLVWVKEYKHGLKINAVGHSNRDIENVREARERFHARFNLPDLVKVDDLTKWVKMLRDYVKTLTYGIAYGLSAFGLARRFHCDVESAQQFIDTFFSIYPKLKNYLDRQADFGERNNYSTSASGRRRYYTPPRRPRLEDIHNETFKYFKEQDREENSVSEEEYKEIFEKTKRRLNKEYHAIIARIRRQAANHKIQGTSADITKYAMVLLEEWVADFCEVQGLDIRRYGTVLTVHDEIVLEFPTRHIKQAVKAMKECMEKSAHAFLGRDVKIVVEPKVADNWKEGK